MKEISSGPQRREWLAGRPRALVNGYRDIQAQGRLVSRSSAYSAQVYECLRLYRRYPTHLPAQLAYYAGCVTSMLCP
jgi:hypothetical protein